MTLGSSVGSSGRIHPPATWYPGAYGLVAAHAPTRRARLPCRRRRIVAFCTCTPATARNPSMSVTGRPNMRL